jgi:hypothetical protein
LPRASQAYIIFILDSLKAHREGLLLDIGIPISIVRSLLPQRPEIIQCDQSHQLEPQDDKNWELLLKIPEKCSLRL